MKEPAGHPRCRGARRSPHLNLPNGPIALPYRPMPLFALRRTWHILTTRTRCASIAQKTIRQVVQIAFFVKAYQSLLSKSSLLRLKAYSRDVKPIELPPLVKHSLSEHLFRSEGEPIYTAHQVVPRTLAYSKPTSWLPFRTEQR